MRTGGTRTVAMRRLFEAMLTALLLTSAFGAALARDVGFQTASLPNAGGRPLEVGIWYPASALAGPHALGNFTQDVAPDAAIEGNALPLVVLSHGSGGSFAGHYDTALALARAGFVAASVTHEGDSLDDTNRRTEIWIRPAQLKQLIDYMVTDWRDRGALDTARIGVFGFSAGGFTALVAAGGTPDLTTVIPYCHTHPEAETCGIVSGTAGTRRRLAEPIPVSDWVHDPRIKAAVVAAPALGFSFGRAGLSGVRIPVQLWRAEFDHVLPSPDYAEAVRAALPAAPEYHVVDNADHYDFLPPCPTGMAKAVPAICQSRPGFDRGAFHARFNADVVGFFERTLK